MRCINHLRCPRCDRDFRREFSGDNVDTWAFHIKFCKGCILELMQYADERPLILKRIGEAPSE